MSFTRKDIIKLFADKGIEITKIDVLRWAEFEYETGVARLVASINPRGYAYSLQTIKSIGKAIKNGHDFYVERIGKYGNDYNFGAENTSKK